MTHTLIFSGNVNIARANTAQALIVPNTATRVEFDHSSIADDDIMWFSMQLTGTVGATITRPVSGAFWKGTTIRTASQGVATGNDTAVLLSSVATNFSRIDLWITRGQETVGGVNRTNRFLIQSNSATLGDAMPLLIFHQPAAGTGGGGATVDQASVYPVVKTIFIPGTNTTLTEDDTNQTIAVNSTNTNTQRTDKEIQDVVGLMVRDGGATTTTYSALAGTLTISSTDTNTQRTDEEIQDVVGNMVVAGTNTTPNYNDTAGTLAINATDTNTQRTDADIISTVANALREGANQSISYDSGTDTITLSATDTNTQRTDEEIVDVVGAAIQGGNGIDVDFDDPNNTITITATASGNLVPTPVPGPPSGSQPGTLFGIDIANIVNDAITGAGGLTAGTLYRSSPTLDRDNILGNTQTQELAYPFQGILKQTTEFEEATATTFHKNMVLILGASITTIPRPDDWLEINNRRHKVTEVMTDPAGATHKCMVAS